jgi:hypothetical protein
MSVFLPDSRVSRERCLEGGCGMSLILNFWLHGMPCNVFLLLRGKLGTRQSGLGPHNNVLTPKAAIDKAKRGASRGRMSTRNNCSSAAIYTITGTDHADVHPLLSDMISVDDVRGIVEGSLGS